MGKKVIASVNGDDLGYPGDRSVHNHALVVTGIDPEAGIVHSTTAPARTPTRRSASTRSRRPG